MLPKLLRVMLIFVVAAGILSVGLMRAVAWDQVPTDQPARALGTGTLFTQPVDPNGKLYLSAWLDPNGSDFDQKIWDDFTLLSNETLTEIDWVGAYDPLKIGAGGPVLDFTLAIYPSIPAGTEPAVAFPPLVQYQTGGNAGETSLGVVGGIPMNAYAFSLPVPFSASAGVKYWVHIVASQGGGSPDWSFAAGAGGNASHYRWGSGSGGDSGYRSVPGDVAFSLLGPVPDRPTDIYLSNNLVDENQLVNTLIGTLTAAHPDPTATFTFSLACDAAGADDASFNILGASLRTSAIFDFETQPAYNICLRVTDQNNMTLDKNFIIGVNNVNEAPAAISLSKSNIDENLPVNTVVGGLTASDPDVGATFTFSLSCGFGGADDASFNILATSLRSSAIFNFETKPTYTVCLRVIDQGGLAFDKNFVIVVNNVFEATNFISLPFILK